MSINARIGNKQGQTAEDGARHDLIDLALKGAIACLKNRFLSRQKEILNNTARKCFKRF